MPSEVPEYRTEKCLPFAHYKEIGNDATAISGWLQASVVGFRLSLHSQELVAII